MTNLGDDEALAIRVDRVRGALPAAVAAEVRALAVNAEATDGVAPLSESALLALEDPEAPVTHLLAAAQHGGPGLLGYAALDATDPDAPSGHLVVGLEHRRRGIGSALLSDARALADPAPISLWSHGALPEARDFATRHALAVGRELWFMRRPLAQAGQDLPGLPDDVGVPAGVSVRAFVPGQDEQAWLTVNSRAFAHHPEQGRMTLHDLLARENEPWFDPAGLLLAEQDGTVLGFVWTKVHPASPVEPTHGELYVLGIDPTAQGLGLGRSLTVRALRRLRDHGLAVATLYTGPENAPAVHLYRSLGFELAAADVLWR